MLFWGLDVADFSVWMLPTEEMVRRTAQTSGVSRGDAAWAAAPVNRITTLQKPMD